MTVEERAKKCLVEIGGIASDEWMLKVLTHALRDQIEDCAKLTDDETMRLERFVSEYKRKGDLDAALRFQGSIVTVAKLGREIRALAGQIDQTEGKEIER
jgi:hypothetical protein